MRGHPAGVKATTGSLAHRRAIAYTSLVDRERFQILAGVACNNNCLFCMERDGADGAIPKFHVTPERVWRLLADHAERDDVMFTTGEPTLNANLPGYIGWARGLGYRRIGVTTNGRRLGYEDYARSLLERGLNHVVLSIHGPDARCHDAQTRFPGSFDQTLAGLQTLARLKSDHRFTVHTSTVVGKRNFHLLGATYALLRDLGVDQCVFNCMQPLGRATCLVRQLAPHYSEVVGEFGRLVAAVGDAFPPLFLLDLPLCTTEGLPTRVRGWLESAAIVMYADDGSSEQRTTRVDKEQAYKVKRAECGRCGYDHHCLGVWRRYVDAYGWDELVPVVAPTFDPVGRQPPGR
jgi:pyruvate-formate lyase-activating enzyme